ncbi:hypothetical protein RIF29_42453 [Crotalaria pallida]|uniref:Reverse transcriptase zinc-binding domain-containing protein n=1 Tax=Crotalaria pallida TaxID=3830 RepID=A0AAN9E9V3_CROPI
MAEKEPQHEYEKQEVEEVKKLSCSYIGLSFSIFLASVPKNAIPLVQNLQSQVRDLTMKLYHTEEQVRQMRSRRQEDSEANARVVEIFATHRNAWQAEEKRLMQQIEAAAEEMARLRARVGELESGEAESKGRVEELEREGKTICLDESMGYTHGKSSNSNFGNDVIWKKIWAVKSLPRYCDLIWRASKNIIPMKQNLLKRGITEDPLCPLCSECEESIVHALLRCREVQPIRFASPLALGINADETNSFLDWITRFLHAADSFGASMIFNLAYVIWQRKIEWVVEISTILSRAASLVVPEIDDSPKTQFVNSHTHTYIALMLVQ